MIRIYCQNSFAICARVWNVASQKPEFRSVVKMIRSLSVVLLVSLAAITLGSYSQSLQDVYFTSFKIYQHALTLAHERNLTADQAEELDRILDEQPNVVYNTLSQLAGHDGKIQQSSDGDLGFVFLNGPLNASQSEAVDKALIQHHLHFTKQIILLLNLTASDLNLSDKTIIDKKIKFYLFGKLSPDSGKTSDYINSVNIIYALIRTRLSQLAYRGELSAKQTISARKTIHTLNEESVQAMVELLDLSETNMTPDELINMIKIKRTDGSLDTETELKIKEVVYFKKLYAIKSLVLLLHMDRSDIELPSEAPTDLIEVIFTPGIQFVTDQSDVKELENEDQQQNAGDGNGMNFFCMSCFHEAYTKWKSENGIEN